MLQRLTAFHFSITIVSDSADHKEFLRLYLINGLNLFLNLVVNFTFSCSPLLDVMYRIFRSKRRAIYLQPTQIVILYKTQSQL